MGLYDLSRIVLISIVLYTEIQCYYYGGKSVFGYGPHYPEGNNTFSYMTGSSGTLREMTGLSFVYNYFPQFNSSNHPYDRNALLTYANGDHMTTCPTNEGLLLWDLDHDGEVDLVSSYGFGFFDNNGARFIGDTSQSSSPFTNFWFGDNLIASYVTMAFGNITISPSGLSRYPQASKWQILIGDSTNWIQLNVTTGNYDAMMLNALYYLSKNDVTNAFSLWQSVINAVSSAYDSNNQQYNYPSMSASSSYQLGLLKILTDFLAISRNDVSGALTQHSLSLRSAILTKIQSTSGSSVINTATMSLWTLGLGAGAFSSFEAASSLQYSLSSNYFRRSYHALSAAADAGSQPGYLSYGPYASLPIGTYSVDFFLRVHLPPNDGSKIVTIEVHNSISDEILSQVDLSEGFLNDQWVMMSTNFTSVDPSATYEFRAYWHGLYNTDLSYVRVRQFNTPQNTQITTEAPSSPPPSPSGASSTSETISSSGTSTSSISGTILSTSGAATSTTQETIGTSGSTTTTLHPSSSSSSDPSQVQQDSSSNSRNLALILGLSIGIGGTLIVVVAIASAVLIFLKLNKRKSAGSSEEIPRSMSGHSEVGLPAYPLQKSESKTSVSSTGSLSELEDQKYFSIPTGQIPVFPRKYSTSSHGSDSSTSVRNVNIVTTEYDNLPSFPPEDKENSLEKLNPAWIISRDDISSEQQEIGRGTFGIVYKAEWRKTPIAIKNLKSEELNPSELENFRREIKLMMSLRPHANVVQFYGIVKKPLGTVCEYLQNGSLLQLLRSDAVISKEKKMSIIVGIARGMLHLQLERIVHRDLAARNVLLSTNLDPKISDFGLSRQVVTDDNTTQDSTGPLKWMAPECIKKRKYSSKSDVWSFGVTCVEVLTRETPYKGIEGVQVALIVVNDRAKPSVPADIPADLHDLIMSCFEYEPAQRPDFAKICDVLTGIFNSSNSSFNLSGSRRG